MKNLLSTLLFLAVASTLSAQIFTDKVTKKYVVSMPDDMEELSVERAGSGELINRFYYWGMDEFKDMKHSIDRDDTLFRGLVLHVTQPVAKKVFGVNYTHTDRLLSYDLIFDAEKKEYTYKFTNFSYQCTETDHEGGELKVELPLEEYKGAPKRSLIDEVSEECQLIVESFTEASENDLTEEQEAESEVWRDTRKDARDSARKAAAQAKKDAEAAAKKAAKEKAKADKAAAKEAASKAREKAQEEKDAE